jgi:SAM-dependent methyltransferase
VDKEQLVAEIKRRAPWYQRIIFPIQNVTTTDNPENAYHDAAWDNVIGDISLAEASILRPLPKWTEIRRVLPDMSGMTVLEIGSNCGFFSFEFAQAGAAQVYGVDVADRWLSNAEFSREVLGLRNVSFSKGDFLTMDFDESGPIHRGGSLLNFTDKSVPLPTNVVDTIFMSTVLDHLFFPLFALYKMIRMARRYVIVDVPTYHWTSEKGVMKFAVEPNGAHHGFVFTGDFLPGYMQRLGVPRQGVQRVFYNSRRNVTIIADVTEKASALVGA